jgi:hypothetical protein
LIKNLNYFTLNNGKIITLIHIDEESCGNNDSMIKADNRLTVGNFMFMKGSMEEKTLLYP